MPEEAPSSTDALSCTRHSFFLWIVFVLFCLFGFGLVYLRVKSSFKFAMYLRMAVIPRSFQLLTLLVWVIIPKINKAFMPSQNACLEAFWVWQWNYVFPSPLPFSPEGPSARGWSCHGTSGSTAELITFSGFQVMKKFGPRATVWELTTLWLLLQQHLEQYSSTFHQPRQYLLTSLNMSSMNYMTKKDTWVLNLASS